MINNTSMYIPKKYHSRIKSIVRNKNLRQYNKVSYVITLTKGWFDENAKTTLVSYNQPDALSMIRNTSQENVKIYNTDSQLPTKRFVPWDAKTESEILIKKLYISGITNSLALRKKRPRLSTRVFCAHTIKDKVHYGFTDIYPLEQILENHHSSEKVLKPRVKSITNEEHLFLKEVIPNINDKVVSISRSPHFKKHCSRPETLHVFSSMLILESA